MDRRRQNTLAQQVEQGNLTVVPVSVAPIREPSGGSLAGWGIASMWREPPLPYHRYG